MGTAALIFPVGSIPISSFNMYTLAILCVALAGAFAAPEAEPVADAHYVPVLWCLMLVLLATLDTLRLMLPGLPRVSVVRGRRRLMPTMDMDCMAVMDTATTPMATDTDTPLDMPDGKQ